VTPTTHAWQGGPAPARTIPPFFRTDVSYLPPLPQLEQREDVLQMLGAANTVFADSPAAAIGMCGVIACFDHPYRSFAVTELLKFLQMAPWSPQVQALANTATEQEQAAYQRAIAAGERYDVEPLLKLELRKQEIRMIGYFYGRQRDVGRIGYEAARIARQLEQVSSRAQSTAHIIAAAGFQFGAISPGRRPTVTWDPQVWDELRKGAALVTQVHRGSNGELEKVVGKVTATPSGQPMTGGGGKAAR
jgi:hypothetical protein